MDALKLIRSKASQDYLISYVADAQPILTEHRSWFDEHHHQGSVFTEQLLQAGSNLVEQGGISSKENAEAVAATENQRQVFAQAQDLASEIRRRGLYVIGEIGELEDSSAAAIARKVRAACGMGFKGSTARQSGLRRLLAAQYEGLAAISETWAKYGQPADSRERVAAALDALQQSIQEQSKEQLEAQLAYQDFDQAANDARQVINRALRLLNLDPSALPEELMQAMTKLEKTHHQLFYSSKSEPQEPELVEEDGLELEE